LLFLILLGVEVVLSDTSLNMHYVSLSLLIYLDFHINRYVKGFSLI
jgi:hypothetical protein